MPLGRLSTPPLGAFPKPEGYPDRLGSAREIADHIDSLTPDGVDMEFVEDYFRGGSAELVFRPLGELVAGNADHNIEVEGRSEAYAALPQSTCPPIVIIDGQIEDGHHRYRVAQAAAWPGMWCYDVAFPEE